VKLISFFYIFMRLAQAASESSATLAEFRLQLPGVGKLLLWHQKMFSAEPKMIAEALGLDRQKEFHAEVLVNGIRLDIKNLSFGYDPGHFVLENLSLVAGRGDVLVVQGESGSGKSTLLSLILGLRHPAKGQILLNGIPVEKLRSFLGQYIAYVGPEPYLISGTVRDNLLYGHGEQKVSDEDLWEALAKAQLVREIKALPNGLNEVLYEHTQLSTGQRQRLAIARAMLRHPRLLILDEASANLDGATEQSFIDGIRSLLPGLTAIIISHKNTFNQIATNRIELRRR